MASARMGNASKAGSKSEVKSADTPITMAFKMVPKPSFSRMGMKPSSTTKPVTLMTRPMDIPVIRATP